MVRKGLSTITSIISTIRKMVYDTFYENEEIRNFLLKYGGGRTTVTKNNETGIAYIELDHSDKNNSLTGKMLVDLRDCVEALKSWKEGKGVIIHGAGRNFCSGGNLDFIQQIPDTKSANALSRWTVDTLTAMQKLPLVTLCLLTGPSLGGGAEIATYCDYILVSDNVRCGFVHGKMGITTAWGGATQLVRRIGKHKALDLVLTCKVMNAGECVEVGFANDVVESKAALEQATKWFASKLWLNSALVRAYKETVTAADLYSCEEATEFERCTLAKFWGGPLNQLALKKRAKLT